MTDAEKLFKETRNEDILQKSEEVRLVKSFEDYRLSDELLMGIYSNGFENPTLPQQCLSGIMEGKDMVLQHNSGTGKTGAFTISALSKIDALEKKLQAIIVSNTRDLAIQSGSVIRTLGAYMGEKKPNHDTGKVHPVGVSVLTAVGGTKVDDDMALLRGGVQVMCGTPGRVKDLLQRAGKPGSGIDISDVRILVLDEADLLLNQRINKDGSKSGFFDDICEIMQLSQPNNTMLVSATITDELLQFADSFLASERDESGAPTKPPVKVLLSRDRVTLRGINQYCIPVDCDVRQDNKLAVLDDILPAVPAQPTIIFVNDKSKAELLAAHLRDRHRFEAEAMHADLPNEERMIRSNNFRTGKTRILVSTSIYNRGIDIQVVSLVFNYDMPKDDFEYIHRIGRAGRHGRKGNAISFIYTKLDGYTPPEELMRDGRTRDEARKASIEERFATKINELQIDDIAKL